jgi:outer membrane protein insertion porin family
MSKQRVKLLIGVVILSGLLTAVVPARGQGSTDSTGVVIKLETTGRASAAELHEAAGLSRRQPIAIDELRHRLQNVLEVLRRRGYFFAAIDTIIVIPPRRDGSLHSGTALINEGNQWRLQMITEAQGNDALSKISRESISRSVNESQFVENANRLLREYARRGYPLAGISFDSVTLDRSASIAFLHARLDAGPRVTVDSILVRGHRVTKREVIIRELPLRQGEVFQVDKVESIPARLMQLGFFRRISPPQLVRDARGRFLLDLELVEGNSNTFNGVAGYNPGNGNEKGYLTGLIDLNFGNLFGTGRLLGARWEKRSRDTQELALRYREPWVFGYPLHFSGAFQQLIQDTIYVERQLEVALEWPASPRLTISGRLSRQSVSPDSLTSAQLGLPKSQVLGAAFGLAYSSLDVPLNPRRGLAYQTTIESGRKSLSSLGFMPGRTIHRQRLTIDFQLAVPFFGDQVLSIALHGRQVTSGEPFVSITDEYRLGGATTLRGYREEQFRGSRVGWSNIEYRYLLGPRSRAVAFIDAGYFFKETAVAKIEKFKSAYGIGARVETPLGVIGVDYGLGEGDGVLQGKVHVSLVNSF